MRWLVVVGTLAIAPTSAFADDEAAIRGFSDKMMGEYERQADAEIQDLCAEEWPTDFAMQDHCYELSVEARNEAQAHDLMGGPPELMAIWGNCAAEWSDEKDRVNWQMMNHCMKQQLAAFERIQKRKQ
jgi:hypothetical protein